MAEPFSKERQLARGERRYRRKVASPKTWAAIRAEKLTQCRLGPTVMVGIWPHSVRELELHHLVHRSQGGDDTADNLVALCRDCHHAVTTRDSGALQVLAVSLTDAEYAYVTSKLGEGGMQRLFGV